MTQELADLVSARDVETALLRPLTDQESPYLFDLIRDACAKLINAKPSLPAQLAAWDLTPRPKSAIDPRVAVAVVAGMIKRPLVNPKGLWSRTESMGPFSESETFPGVRGGEGAAEAIAGVVVTAGDLAQLRPPRTRTRLGTVRLSSGLSP